ncbi:hypothetical protein [Parasitella parasitica]|uniref:Protein kinase domain-containing protein n=1 Tax=Parasitella parasitica TaxID=35722 RepID=A0A0B7NW29_9FUNG|nr:hypothetical protein [Parasitella parasitica]
MSVYSSPYVIMYGGSQDISNSSATIGSNDVWVWDSRNGSWYQPTIQVQGGVSMLPQIYFKATTLPSQGQIVALVSNTTGGSATNVLQKLDINSWSWSFPTTNFQASARTVGYSMLTINNTIYTYGGLAVDANGFAMSSSIQNSLSLMDVNSFQWTTGSNGLGLADHTTCYMKACNCLVIFGGTPTGSPTDVTDAVNLYDLTSRAWNVQGIRTAAGSPAPGARRLHTANCLDDYMVIYGGGTNQPADTDVWILNATSYPTLTWQKIAVANQSQGPNLRMGHSSVLDEANKKLYMFGGWGVSATNDSNVYVLDLNQWSWTRVAPTGYPPHAMPTVNTTDPNSSQGQPNTNHTSTIVGAAVGGALGLLLLIAVAAFFIIRKRRRERGEKNDELSENTTSVDSHYHADNPYSYNPRGFYSTNDSDDDDDNNNNNNNNDDEALAVSNKRMSKAWTGTMSTHHSQRRSELGDSDRIITGRLEAYNDDGTLAATHGSRSRGGSFRNSKVLLVSPATEAQVPNEIVAQKPNEFSVLVAKRQQQQQQQLQPVHHLISSAEEGPNSSSLDVLRSIKTNASSMMNHTGNSQSAAFRKKVSGVPVTHATAHEEDEDNWTFADSLSVHPHGGPNDSTPPIQYILPSSHQLSTATSTQTWDTRDAHQRQTLVNHHHNSLQYPSSTLNMPMAQTVTPPISNDNSNDTSSSTHELRTSNHVNIYNTISPLDALASLGQQQQQQQYQQQHQYQQHQQQLSTNTPSSSAHNSAMVKSIRDTSGRGIVTADVTAAVAAASTTTPTSSSTTTATNSSSATQPDDYKFLSLAPLISALPRRYQLDRSKAPITGPANNILFATKEEKLAVAVKSFGRREAWERECRNLIKLKSPCVVEILEVLTIQNDLPQAAALQQQQQQQQQQKQQQDEEGGIQYVTVMERLDETLGSFIRHSSKRPATPTPNGSIARDILRCLSWCHGNGIAFCDLKPSNIMHHHGESWKLIDFEASRTIDEECVGVITPRYCPPEVARATTYGLEGANGVVATASVDLWSLGCVIYELETKKALFASNIKDETILHFVSHPSPSTPILNNGLRWNESKELEIPQLDRLIPNAHTRHLIKTLLSRDPNKRGSAPRLLEDPYFSL